jgi:hypothetical protein
MFAIVLFSMTDPYSGPRLKEKEKVKKTMHLKKNVGFVPPPSTPCWLIY